MSSNDTSNSCNICCDQYNKSTRSKICCAYCEFAACRTCCETYILSEPSPKCMNTSCAKEWSRKFIREKFTGVFINGKYKEHLENILFDQEKALLPATQPFVEEEIRKQKVREEIKQIDKRIWDLQRQKREMEHLIHYAPVQASADASSGPRFVRSCPANDCRGFLSSQWKCGICELWTCPKCHELKGPERDCEHTCDPNSVETAKLLEKDTKPCPKCQSQIFKISGCFAENTPILLWDGTTKMSQNICIGDVLVGDDGEKRIVEELVSGQDELYEIQQNNAMAYTVNSKHMLALKFVGEKSIIWMENTNSWNICWFDRMERKMKTKQFKADNNCNKDLMKKQAELFLENLKLEDIVLITVDDYLTLDQRCKKKLLGFKSCDGVHYETSFVVKPVGKGDYYGWSVDKNKRFLLSDFTVAKNCDQMWCTQCHTAFSWKTGAIEKNIHNPHYYEWQRKNGGLARAEGDVECGRELTHRTTDSILQLIRTRHIGLIDIEKKKKREDDPKYAKNATYYLPIVNRLCEIIRLTIHNVRNELPQYQTDYVRRNQDLRIQYLKKQLSEEQFKWQIQVNNKRSRKNTEIAQVIQLSNTAVTDVVYRIIDDLRKSPANDHHFEAIMREFDEIINYCNDILADISFAYNSVRQGFDKTFKLGRWEEPCAKKPKATDNETNESNKVVVVEKAK